MNVSIIERTEKRQDKRMEKYKEKNLMKAKRRFYERNL
jgi:hypothetical protein